ncbi:MAG: hypothetical protein V1865_01280 [bacterium]
MKKTIFLFFTFLFSFALINAVHAENSFNPNYIISDYEMLKTDSMALGEIQAFLVSKSSYLANYKTADAFGQTRSAAEIIFNAVNYNYNCDGIELTGQSEIEKKFKCRPAKTINPKFLLVLLQKEMSLIEDSTPTQSQLDWAMGYGCPDGASCNPRWKGFGKQVNSAALQFRDYLDHPNYYSYKKGQTYTFTNRYASTDRGTTVVTPLNNATAALYNYTPHVYNGNYNFWNIWNRYWGELGKSIYPNGTLLQADGEDGVWLLDNGVKRAIVSQSVLASRFDTTKIVQIEKTLLDAFPRGVDVKFPQYSIIKAPDSKIYLLVGDKKRNFADYNAFRQLGYNPEEIIEADWADISSYRDGKPITADDVYPQGILLRDQNTGGIFWVEEGTKAPLIDWVFMETMFKGKHFINTTAEDLDKYETIVPVKFNNGELIKIEKAPGVYVIDNEKLRPITSGEIFNTLGYKWENIISVPVRVFQLYELGEPMTLE